ncbi:hypothetical protein WHR41_07916 [Cladosporium halotolerans]|uniref:DUF7918 domain-containing protein n=1 Tax=Cladosporium halotolerans TaxID=1052096 RepID=A0AB34KEP6_9PEZI
MRADCLPFASIVVRVNGQDVQEHQTEPTSADNVKTAVTYIEAVDGAAFGLHLILERGFAYTVDHLIMQVSLDGKWVTGRFVELQRLKYGRECLNVTNVHETVNGVTTARDFLFATHQTTDQKLDKNLSKDEFARLGEVKVHLYRCRKGKHISSYGRLGFTATGKDGIPEKALKGRAISHHTELGPAKQATVGGIYDASYPYGSDPIATFVFKYRSHKDLQVEGIIERSPSPVPLEDRDPETLTPEELREQNRLLRARQEAINNIKSEVKQEARKRKRQRSVTVGREQHDDTDEGDEGDVTFTGVSGRRKVPRPEDIIDLIDD